jgi:predicted glycogen debranching enzyme
VDAVLVRAGEGGDARAWGAPSAGTGPARALRAAERTRRAAFASPLDRAADAYVVRRDAGLTIVAGYPWFGDWGRDTFIALRGLCLATGRIDDAGRMLDEWADLVAEGMIPNRLPDRGDQPEYNSVDASLWYAIAVAEYLALGSSASIPSRRVERLRGAVDAILDGYSRGTRHGICADADGLLAAGEPGVQLTWMDSKIGDWVVTPRVGKPVEIQALWLNALAAASDWRPALRDRLELGLASFERRFWSAERGFLHDVVDVDHVPGMHDSTLRPNQILAIGGLPLPLVTGARARSIVDVVERELLTPLGLRSLGPREPAYVMRYEGGVRERDSSYHQGTVWPWLIGPFVEAWVRVHGADDRARSEAAARFLPALDEHRNRAGLGHISEIADAEPPHTPRGCPFQAWSLGEYLRFVRRVLAPTAHPGTRRRKSRRPAGIGVSGG